jgi:hypothetical protein
MSLIPFGFWAASGGGAAGGFDLLETTTLSTSASSVTFSGLGAYSDYKHLQIRAIVRESSSATGSTSSQLTFNSDTGSNYSWHYLRGYGSGILSSGAASQAHIRMQSFAAGDGSASGVFGVGVIDILDFASSKNKTVRVLQGAITNATDVLLTSGAYYSTDAVTSINFAIGSNSFVAATRLSLYGVK